jgi:modification methylase
MQVPFEKLISEKLIVVGEPLYNKKVQNVAYVLSDGGLQYMDNVGSIHRIGAEIQQSQSCNGWKFWYVLRNNKFVLIDDIRGEYIRKFYGIHAV